MLFDQIHGQRNKLWEWIFEYVKPVGRTGSLKRCCKLRRWLHNLYVESIHALRVSKNDWECLGKGFEHVYSHSLDLFLLQLLTLLRSGNCFESFRPPR